MMAVFERAELKGTNPHKMPAIIGRGLAHEQTLRDAGPGRAAFTLNSNEQPARLWANGRFE